jgi:nitrous oxide reductase accessory protein NosL
MRKVLCIVVVAASLLLAPFSPARSAELKCAECGMLVDRGSKYYAWIVQDKGTLPFCDVGDLLTYLNKKSLSPGPARVKDYPGGDMINADKAFYVHAENTFKTPMGWGIAAFKDKGEAEKFGTVLDFAGAAKAVK